MGNFPKFRPKISKLSVLPENWHSWYIGGADSESRLRISKFRPQIFLGENLGWKSQSCPFSLKIGTRDILEELILMPDLEFRNSDCKIHFWANLGRKSQRSLFCLKIGMHGILEELILHPDLDFQNSDLKIHFWPNLGRKSQSCPFCVKIGTQSISKMLILIPTLVFWTSNPKSIFGQVWDKKVKAVSFAWKLVHTHTVSCGCWFLFQHWFSQISNPIFEMLILILRLVFWNSKPKLNFWANLSRKGWIVYFTWKLVHRVSRGGDL